MNNENSDKPIYIPKVINHEIIDSGINYPLVIVDAHSVIHKSKIFQETSTKYGVMIDPVTHHLQYKNKRETTSFQGLPYKDATDIGRIHADPTYRLDNLVRPVLDFQIENGAALIVAPYLCSEEIHSTIFNTNITLVTESITNLQSKGSTLPLYAPICTSASALKEQTAINAIVDFYTDESIAQHVAGYYVMIADFNDESADPDELLGAANLVYQLSQGKHVIVKQLGAFGYVLNAVSNCSFTSSPAGGEVFSLKLMASDFTPRRDHNEWMYVPELYDYVNDFELSEERINYHCDCSSCAGQFSTESKTKQRKIHYLLRREQEVQALMKMSQHEKIDYLLGSFDAAIRFANECTSRFGSKLATQHIYRWAEVLQRARTWNFQEDEQELEAFLKALE